MKFSIQTTQSADKASWKVTIDCPNDAFKFEPRELKHIGDANSGFPVAAAVLASWQGLPYESLSAPPKDDPINIKNLYENIIVDDLAPGDIENFGNYLRSVLLGDNWARMLEAAAKEQIELDLHFECADLELNRLPWEMMYATEGALGATPGRDVAITRIIPCEFKGEAASLSLPLKVLFVIGRQLDDKLRPGAEYLGLLKRMNIPFEGAPKGRNIDLNTRFLMEATREDLKNAMAAFHPHVVHFICHGTVDAEGGHILLTKSPDDSQNAGVLLEEDPCSAEQLLDAMSDGKAPNNLPPIVVLNACHTADTDKAGANASTDIKGAYLSLAAELVAGGVPVAIGMAGEIADAACRIFTRNFYQALIKREPVALATARGRRAAMYYYKDFYTNSVEWVRPTLFAAEGMLATLSISEEAQEAMLKVSEIPSRFLGDKNVLCGRFRYLRAYQQFHQEVASGGEQQMLAFRVSEKEDKAGLDRFGKTRLIEEIAAHSVLDGYIPCLIRNQPTLAIPTNLWSLAILLADNMNVTRQRFKIPIKPERRISAALKRAAALCGVELNPDLRGAFGDAKAEINQKLNALGTTGQPEVIKEYILEDFQLLDLDVNGPADATKTDRRKLLLLIDDLHLYEGVAPLLLSEAMTGPYGIGDYTMPVPMVFTYSAFPEELPKALEDVEDFINRGKYVFKEDLHRIDDEYEARLAYSQFLLSRQQPLSFNWLKSKQAAVEGLLRVIHKHIAGVPKRLYVTGGYFDGALDSAIENDTLLAADYEQIMQNLKQQDEAG